MAYKSLRYLEKENIEKDSTYRLEYVLRKLNESQELESGLTWSSTIWENCTIEELIGGLIEAENLLRRMGRMKRSCEKCKHFISHNRPKNIKPDGICDELGSVVIEMGEFCEDYEEEQVG